MSALHQNPNFYWQFIPDFLPSSKKQYLNLLLCCVFHISTSHFVYFSSLPSCVQVLYNHLSEAWGTHVWSFEEKLFCFARNQYLCCSLSVRAGNNISGNSWDWYVLEGCIHFLSDAFNLVFVVFGHFAACCSDRFLTLCVEDDGWCFSTSSAEEGIINSIVNWDNYYTL